MEDEEEEEMKVVSDYDRKAAREGARARGRMVVSPITGELVPLEEMQEHMRVHMIDPK